jgi:carboxyl-terminal processing protease
MLVALLAGLVLPIRLAAQETTTLGVDLRDDGYVKLQLFFETLEKIQEYYVEELSSNDLIDLALDGILEGLDPHSRLLVPDDFDSLRSKTRGRFFGVGVVMAIRGDVPTVIAPIDNSPAKRGGVRSGDRLVSVDGIVVTDFDLGGVVELLRGQEGTPVTLELERAGGGERYIIDIERSEIRLESVTGPLFPNPDTAYIRLSRFSESTGNDLAHALDTIDQSKVQGLILDLRGNPGGLLSQAVEVAESFIGLGDVIVEVRSRNRIDSRIYRAERDYRWRGNVVVLIDEGSASAAEIVAGAIQDHARGLVVGETTFGKGSVQSIFAFDSGHALKLTTAQYVTPSGRSVERVDGDPEGGIHPDIIVSAAQADSVVLSLLTAGTTRDYVDGRALGIGDVTQPLSPSTIADFRSFAGDRSALGGVSDDVLDRVLREEVALRHDGETAALSIRLGYDPQVLTAVRILTGGEPILVAAPVEIPADAR